MATQKKKYLLHRSVPVFLDKMREHKEPYITEILGKELVVYPDVLSPHYDWSGIFHVRHLGNVEGKQVLDMGCGSGIIGLFAAFNGVRKVLATDINPRAVENTRENFKKYNLNNARAIESDLFSAVNGAFDLIVFNLPYHGAKTHDLLERAVSDENYVVMEQFLAQAKDYLAPGGEIQVGFSTSGDVDLLREKIAKHNYVIEKIYSESDRGYNCQLYVLSTDTSQKTISLLDTKTAHEELEGDELISPTSAQGAVRKLLIKSKGSIATLRNYEFGQTIVDSGVVVDRLLAMQNGFQYAKVPFGIITKGTVTVYERNVGVRRLGVGDCIGVFETAHWLNSASSRKIGEWTLIADGDVEVLFLAESLGRDGEFRNFLLNFARADHVPQPVTNLTLLDWTAAHTTEKLLTDTAIVVHSHILPTNIALIRHLAHLVGIDKIFILEKPYSTVQSCLGELARAGIDVVGVPFAGSLYHDALERGIHVLWRKIAEAHANRKFSRLLILDDGGDLWATIPWQNLRDVKISGVEQTQRGVARFRQADMHLPPIVSVASSGVKKIVESEFIGASIVEKLFEAKQLQSRRVGVIGMGNIGQAIFKHLQERNIHVIVYDSEKPNAVSAAEFRNSIDTLVQDADLVIGATGVDILRGVTLDKVCGSKMFASASSVDIEFQTLTRLASSNQGMFDDIRVFPHANLECTVLNGGFPVNFDRQREWEPKANIAITRCLLYVGMMQAVRLIESVETAPGFYALDTLAQKQILSRWLDERQEKQENFSDIERIANAIFVEGAKKMPSVWNE